MGRALIYKVGHIINTNNKVILAMNAQNVNNKNNKNSVVTQDVNKTKKKETFIVLYERYLLDGNLDLLDKLFYAFFVSLHCAGNVIDISNCQLANKIKDNGGKFISIPRVKRSLKRLEDMGYIKRYTNKNKGERIIVPIIKQEFEEIDESKADIFYDRYGNEYHPAHIKEPRVIDDPGFKNVPPTEQECSTYIKENIKENYIHNSQYNEPKKKSRYSENFELFWNASNKRGEKIKAYSAWKAHKLDNKVDLLIALLETNYQRKHGDKATKYKPHISTWINYCPWEEGEAKTEEEIIAKAHEQLQSTKDNLPAKVTSVQIIDQECNTSDSTRLQDCLVPLGVFINSNLREAFILGLKGRNIDTSGYNLEIISKELIKIREKGLSIERCIEKFLMSSWKSFSVDYFLKDDVKSEKGSWFDDPYAPHNLIEG